MLILKHILIHYSKKNNILKFADQYLLILSNLMWDFDHGKLPTSLNQWFTRIDHSYNTRNAKKGKLKPLIYSTKKYGLYTFSNEGTKTLNLLKDTDLYNNSTSKKCFTNKLKLCFLSNY